MAQSEFAIRALFRRPRDVFTCPAHVPIFLGLPAILHFVIGARILSIIRARLDLG